ncbi:PIN domain-containing protein [Bradyrhizobium sp. LB11.1]|uniref:PIN domain-containing protein n=1 Tax=Bradyrhizobium sp. LB11.1 TaxID=3156326 RepID=UPI00339140EE
MVANSGDGLAPAFVFLDTSVWLDLAANEAGEPLLGALEHLNRLKAIELAVPQIVRDEFARNKDRVVQDSGRSLSAALDRATGAIWKYGNPRRRRNTAAALSDIKHQLNGALDITAEAVTRIETLFAASTWLGDKSAAIEAASTRALEKRAPFHTGKNSFADAVIIELYGQLRAATKGRCVFVTHNKKDFGLPNGDQRLPHPDIAEHFSRIKSRYFIKLVDALRALRPQEFAEAMYEHEFTMEPRRASEISDAIRELTDRVWYDRHMVMRYKVETGKCKIIAKKDFGPKYYRASALGKLIVDDILAGAIRSAERVEKRYGKENLGPYSKFDWGMINGKLSALRWVFGEDWDELYT